jgi:hypothetical protein
MELSNFLYLVIFNTKRADLPLDLSIVELFHSNRGITWLFKADETKAILLYTFFSVIFFREETNALNFTKWRKYLANNLFGPVLRNVLDVQVASLL